MAKCVCSWIKSPYRVKQAKRQSEHWNSFVIDAEENDDEDDDGEDDNFEKYCDREREGNVVDDDGKEEEASTPEDAEGPEES